MGKIKTKNSKGSDISWKNSIKTKLIASMFNSAPFRGAARPPTAAARRSCAQGLDFPPVCDLRR